MVPLPASATYLPEQVPRTRVRHAPSSAHPSCQPPPLRRRQRPFRVRLLLSPVILSLHVHLSSVGCGQQAEHKMGLCSNMHLCAVPGQGMTHIPGLAMGPALTPVPPAFVTPVPIQTPAVTTAPGKLLANYLKILCCSPHLLENASYTHKASSFDAPCAAS